MPFPKCYGSYSSPSSQSSLFPTGLGVIRITPTTSDLDNITNSLLSANVAQDKKDKKAKMKDAVATAKHVITSYTKHFDIVEVEVLLDVNFVKATQGGGVATWLDAGAQRVVLDEESVHIARVPPHRVVLMCRPSTIPVPDPSLSLYLNIPLISLSLTTTTPGLKEKSEHWFNSYKNPKGVRGIVEVGKEADIKVEEIVSMLKSGWSVVVEDGDSTLLATATALSFKTDRPDGLFTTVVVDRTGVALGLVYSNVESVVKAVGEGKGIYWSRSRGGLWRKGDTSGCYQTLYRIDADCDGDAVRFTVKQHGEPSAFCHEGTEGCWGLSDGLGGLERTVKDRLVNSVEGSYTKRLFEDETLLRNKLVEEAQELSEAQEPRHIAEELADVLYFAMVRAAKGGVGIEDAVKVLDERAKKVTRRPGNDKKERIEAAAKILDKK